MFKSRNVVKSRIWLPAHSKASRRGRLVEEKFALFWMPAMEGMGGLLSKAHRVTLPATGQKEREQDGGKRLHAQSADYHLEIDHALL